MTHRYREDIEDEIMREEPYSPIKHFLWDLPDLFYFILKAGIIYGLVYIIFGAMTVSLVQTLPTFCNALK